MRNGSLRGIFFRTLSLLSLGISLLFVLDGPKPPGIKKSVKSRRKFHSMSLQYMKLLQGMGLPVIIANGEAEKLCAALSQNDIVHGVLTEDGDSILYGAKIVYKGLSTDYRGMTAHEYRIEDVGSDLHLTQRDLIAFALLSKGDFCDGVPHVGEKHFMKLHREFQTNKVKDMLSRVIEWKSDTNLYDLQRAQLHLKDIAKLKHCTKCSHEGTKQSHGASGCRACVSSSDCSASSQSLCPCAYHQAEAEIKPHSVELKVRRLALENCPEFPDLNVTDEYLNEGFEIPNDVQTALRKPYFHTVCRMLKDKVNMDTAEALQHLIPACIRMAMFGLLSDFNVKPICIEGQCIYKGEKSYKVKWSKVELTGFSQEDIPDEILTIPVEVFSKFYPEMTKEFQKTEKANTGGRKRKMVGRPPPDANQRKMTDMFKVVKKSVPSRTIVSEASCSSENQGD